jgi:hypothetical protein
MPDRDYQLRVCERVASVLGRLSPGQPADCTRPLRRFNLVRETNGVGRAGHKVAIS